MGLGPGRILGSGAKGLWTRTRPAVVLELSGESSSLNLLDEQYLLSTLSSPEVEIELWILNNSSLDYSLDHVQ